jgi:hypothetical protein
MNAYDVSWNQTREERKRERETYPLTEILDLWLSECEILHLLLQITHLAVLDLDLFDIDALLTPSLCHSFLLGWAEEKKSFAFRLISSGTPDSVNVGVDVFRCVELNDPVYCWEIESTGGYIGTYQQG